MNFSDSDLLFKKLRTYDSTLERDEVSVRKAIIKFLKIEPTRFAENLKTIRESKGISQIGLSNYLGISQTSYSAWETGNHVPRIAKLELLSQLLEVDVGDLFPEAQVKADITYIPVFKSIDFLYKTLGTFKSVPASFSQEKTIDYYNGAYQFAYVVEDDSMVGADNLLPKNSLIFCSNSELSIVSDKLEQLLALSGKVVLLSIAKGPALLRELSFDGTYIRIKAWNSNIPEKICLSSGSKSLPKGKESFALYNNHPLTVSMIEVFGVARKQVQDIK